MSLICSFQDIALKQHHRLEVAVKAQSISGNLIYLRHEALKGSESLTCFFQGCLKEFDGASEGQLRVLADHLLVGHCVMSHYQLEHLEAFHDVLEFFILGFVELLQCPQFSIQRF